MQSVIITAFNPPIVEYTIVIEQAINKVNQPGIFKTISPNFMAAKLTLPIIKILNTKPKYKALNPLKKAAGFPPYLNS